MKKILLLAFCLCGFIAVSTAQAKYPHELSLLKNERILKVVLDYSSVVDKLFVTDDQIVEWNSGKAPKELLKDCMGIINEQLISHRSNLRASNLEPSKYKMLIKVTKLDKHGNTKADISFIDTDLNKVMYAYQEESEGGSHGDLFNLMGDGIKEMGGNIGDFVGRKTKSRR